MNNIDILEEPKDILFEIDMQLYDEFNDKFCEINENLGTIYTYKDLEDIKQAEKDTEIKSLRQAIKTLIAENKELKEENEKMEELIENSECDMSTNYIPKSKVEMEIHDIDNWLEGGRYIYYGLSPYKLEAQKKALQSLLGKE